MSEILFFSAKSKRRPSLIYSMQIIPVCLSIVARRKGVSATRRGGSNWTPISLLVGLILASFSTGYTPLPLIVGSFLGKGMLDDTVNAPSHTAGGQITPKFEDEIGECFRGSKSLPDADLRNSCRDRSMWAAIPKPLGATAYDDRRLLPPSRSRVNRMPHWKLLSELQHVDRRL